MDQVPKKVFCARCFLPIDGEDKVEIDDQHFHRTCSMCCICRKVPSSLKMFNSHIFCNECFKTHVVTKFRGDGTQYANCCPQGERTQFPKESKEDETSGNPGDQPKRPICARCLLSIDEKDMVTVCNQNFHSHCANCCLCHTVPLSNLKIYYGQMFCESCFYRHVLNRNRDNPSDFFKFCFKQWQNNEQFTQNMRGFIGGNSNCTPSIFMMPQNQQPFCRCGTDPSEWFSNNEPKKSVTPATSIEGSLDIWDLTYENCIEVSDIQEPVKTKNYEKLNVIEKIEKLTKYLNGSNIRLKDAKDWKILERDYPITTDSESICGWIELQKPKKVNCLKCPQCLWQCGSIFVNNAYLEKYI